MSSGRRGRTFWFDADRVAEASGAAVICNETMLSDDSWNLFEIVLFYWIRALIIGVFQRRKVRDHVFSVVMDLDSTTTPAMIAVWMSIKTTVDLGAHVIEHTESRRVPAA